MPTSPFHNKGDARLMQDILTYQPTQPDTRAQADATRNEGATAAQAQPLTPAEFVRLLREKWDSDGDGTIVRWLERTFPLVREATRAEVEAHNAKAQNGAPGDQRQ